MSDQKKEQGLILKYTKALANGAKAVDRSADAVRKKEDEMRKLIFQKHLYSNAREMKEYVFDGMQVVSNFAGNFFESKLAGESVKVLRGAQKRNSEAAKAAAELDVKIKMVQRTITAMMEYTEELEVLRKRSYEYLDQERRAYEALAKKK